MYNTKWLHVLCILIIYKNSVTAMNIRCIVVIRWITTTNILFKLNRLWAVPTINETCHTIQKFICYCPEVPFLKSYVFEYGSSSSIAHYIFIVWGCYMFHGVKLLELIAYTYLIKFNVYKLYCKYSYQCDMYYWSG